MNAVFGAVATAFRVSGVLSQESAPSTFLIYAHDDENSPAQGPASAELVLTLIAKLQEVNSKLRSDRGTVLHLTSSTDEDFKTENLILNNQACLLPEKIAHNHVQNVIVAVSPRLNSYWNDEKGIPYVENLIRKIDECHDVVNPESPYEFDKLVLPSLETCFEAYYQREGFHHVLTELAMLKSRVQHDSNPETIFPLWLPGTVGNVYLDFIPRHQVYIPYDPTWHKLLHPSEAVYAVVFRLLAKIYKREPFVEKLNTYFQKGVKILKTHGCAGLNVEVLQLLLSRSLLEELDDVHPHRAHDVEKLDFAARFERMNHFDSRHDGEETLKLARQLTANYDLDPSLGTVDDVARDGSKEGFTGSVVCAQEIQNRLSNMIMSSHSLTPFVKPTKGVILAGLAIKHPNPVLFAGFTSDGVLDHRFRTGSRIVEPFHQWLAEFPHPASGRTLWLYGEYETTGKSAKELGAMVVSICRALNLPCIYHECATFDAMLNSLTPSARLYILSLSYIYQLIAYAQSSGQRPDWAKWLKKVMQIENSVAVNQGLNLAVNIFRGLVSELRCQNHIFVIDSLDLLDPLLNGSLTERAAIINFMGAFAPDCNHDQAVETTPRLLVSTECQSRIMMKRPTPYLTRLDLGEIDDGDGYHFVEILSKKLGNFKARQ